MTLKTYFSKRTFEKTPEPKPSIPKSTEKTLIFCIQKHAASHLHYDFRLEHKGVLLSWAVPKGPSLDPSIKRMAIQVEDHPYDYRNFEGIIPAGNYGAGSVLLWDEGTYTLPEETSPKNISKKIDAGLMKGHIDIVLNGSKLKGAFTLIKLPKDDKSWLLIKKRDSYSTSEDVTELNQSVRSHKTIEEIGGKEVTKIKDVKGKSLKKIPKKIAPMLAKLIDKPFDDENWLFETKWDGYRAMAYIENTLIDLRSRNNLSFNQAFPPVVQDLKLLKVNAIIDGEIVLLDEKGRSSFQLMQNYQRNREGILCYYAFDILYLNGKDLRELPLIERKKYLKQLLDSKKLKLTKFSSHIENQGVAFFKAAQEHQLEGIIGKKKESTYVSKRTSNWVKIKTHQRQEAVIGGFTAPKGSRSKFGSLLLGVYEQGKLVYIGHSGGGFNEQLLTDVYERLLPLVQKDSPFKNGPKPSSQITWVKPELVCEVSFSEWTSDGLLRQPVFQGMRLDKTAKEVVKEVEMHLPIKEIEEKKDKISNPEKIYWPSEGYSKQDLIDYYLEVSPILLPHLKNRPMILHRYPEGIQGQSFYQKESRMLHLPSYIETVPIEHDEKVVHYIMVQNEETLKYIVNLGSIELHPFMTQHGKDNPDFLVIDLDPEDISFDEVIKAAQKVHTILDSLGIDNYCKTSGKRGLHIYIPLQGKYSYQQVKQFREILSLIIHQKIPSVTSLERKPKNRQKKIYIDVIQNNPGQAVAAPYSVRAVPKAPIATPLKWSEVKVGLNPENFTIKTVPQRLKKIGDIFEPVLKDGIDLNKVLKNIGKSTK